jgi:hypothetical protein
MTEENSAIRPVFTDVLRSAAQVQIPLDSDSEGGQIPHKAKPEQPPVYTDIVQAWKAGKPKKPKVKRIRHVLSYEAKGVYRALLEADFKDRHRQIAPITSCFNACVMGQLGPKYPQVIEQFEAEKLLSSRKKPGRPRKQASPPNPPNP